MESLLPRPLSPAVSLPLQKETRPTSNQIKSISLFPNAANGLVLDSLGRRRHCELGLEISQAL